MFSIQGLRIFTKTEISTIQRRLKMTMSELSLYGSGLAYQKHHSSPFSQPPDFMVILNFICVRFKSRQL